MVDISITLLISLFSTVIVASKSLSSIFLCSNDGVKVFFALITISSSGISIGLVSYE